jgi:hypothetical protein
MGTHSQSFRFHTTVLRDLNYLDTYCLTPEESFVDAPKTALGKRHSIKAAFYSCKFKASRKNLGRFREFGEEKYGVLSLFGGEKIIIERLCQDTQSLSSV